MEIGGAGATKLAQCALRANVRLLTLSQNRIGDAGAVAIAQIFQSKDCLQVLSLGYNRIGSEGASALAEGLSSSAKRAAKLEQLSLEGNQIGDRGATAFGEMLRNAPVPLALRELFVRFNEIG